MVFRGDQRYLWAHADSTFTTGGLQPDACREVTYPSALLPRSPQEPTSTYQQNSSAETELVRYRSPRYLESDQAWFSQAVHDEAWGTTTWLDGHMVQAQTSQGLHGHT